MSANAFNLVMSKILLSGKEFTEGQFLIESQNGSTDFMSLSWRSIFSSYTRAKCSAKKDKYRLLNIFPLAVYCENYSVKEKLKQEGNDGPESLT